MSSCLGGGRTYRLDLDIVKSPAASASAPARSSSSSSSASSSLLSDSSNSPLLAISIKKPRAPRKRPNQTYNEAAALLSTAYPTVFLPSKALSKQPKPLLSHSSSSKFPDPSADLLPAFPVLGSDAAFLIRRPADQKPLHPDAAAEQQPALSSPTSALTAEFRDGGCNSPALSPAVSNEFREPPDSPAFSDDDFDAESILDEEAAAAEQGIDAILGNLSVSASANSNENENETGNGNGNENENGNSHSIRSCGVNPYIKSLMGFGLLGSKFELGLGFTYGRSVHRALRQRDGGYRWSSPTVPVKDICSKFKAPTASSSAPPPEVKKSKKKSKKVEKKVLVDTDSPAAAAAATADAEQAGEGSKRVALGLKLNHDEVLKAWSDRGSMFSSDGPDSPNSSAEALAKLADIDLVPENGAASVLREASVMRYKEKRRSRLFAKKIRYQVRKVNADCRPRMKASGRFVRRPSLLQQAIVEEES